jgi:Kef-type K+ transport system membrane component KefB
MTAILLAGLLLLFALLLGMLARRLRVPEVTAYIITGVLVGPSVFKIISHDTLSSIGVFSQVALGLILFSIGTSFNLNALRNKAATLLKLSLFEGVGTALIVTLVLRLIGVSWELSFLLGSLAVETAAATTLLVLREYNAKGPLTSTIVPLIAINNLICLTFFTFVLTGIQINRSSGNLNLILGRATFDLAWAFIGGAALGLLVGYLLVFWTPLCSEHGEALILIIGCILLLVGAAQFLQTSSLVATLMLGATVTNLSQRTEHLFAALQKIDPPIYAIFFVSAGAELDLKSFAAAGGMGICYFLFRLMGKYLGAYFGTRYLQMSDIVKKYLSIAIISQAGLAVGLLTIVRVKVPEMAATVTAVVLSAILVYEIIGPFGTRYAIFQANEAGKVEEDDDLSLL